MYKTEKRNKIMRCVENVSCEFCSRSSPLHFPNKAWTRKKNLLVLFNGSQMLKELISSNCNSKSSNHYTFRGDYHQKTACIVLFLAR